jgi:hypothetical protein
LPKLNPTRQQLAWQERYQRYRWKIPRDFGPAPVGFLTYAPSVCEQRHIKQPRINLSGGSSLNLGLVANGGRSFAVAQASPRGCLAASTCDRRSPAAFLESCRGYPGRRQQPECESQGEAARRGPAGSFHFVFRGHGNFIPSTAARAALCGLAKTFASGPTPRP